MLKALVTGYGKQNRVRIKSGRRHGETSATRPYSKISGPQEQETP